MRTVYLCVLGVACLVVVPFVPDYAITIFISWLVLAGIHGVASLLGR